MDLSAKNTVIAGSTNLTDTVVCDYAQAIGGRYYQEDAYVFTLIRANTALVAVSDGHGGSSVSDIVIKEIVSIFNTVINDNPNSSWNNIINIVFERLAEITNDNYSGATLSLVVVDYYDMRAWVAVLGDSPVFIINPHAETWVSPEHNARTNLSEREAAIKLGAIYINGYLGLRNCRSGLQMSRAFGDAELSKFISRVPEIIELELLEESIIAVCSDGVIDPGHLQVVNSNSISNLLLSGGSAKDVVNFSLESDLGDNVTVVTIQNRRK